METLTASISAVLDQDTDRRRGPRDRVCVRAKLKSLDPVTSVGPSTVVEIVEISRRGLKLFVTRPYLPNAIVQVTVLHDVVMGRVRYCTETDNGFHVGIAITQ